MLTAGPILGTLVEVVNERRCDVGGVVDDTQVDDVFRQWQTNGVSAWKIPLLQTIVTGARLAGKPSTPWSPGVVHDSMHAKVVVADDVSFVGSFNFSRSGEQNAENVLEIRDPATADRLADYVDEVRARTRSRRHRTSARRRRECDRGPRPPLRDDGTEPARRRRTRVTVRPLAWNQGTWGAPGGGCADGAGRAGGRRGAPQATPARRKARLSFSISRAITSRCTSWVPS